MKERKYTEGKRATGNFERLAKGIFKISKGAIVPPKKKDDSSSLPNGEKKSDKD